MREDVANFFRSLVKQTMQTRESQKIVRPDMIHVLIQAKNGVLKSDESQYENNEDVSKRSWINV